MFLTSPLIEQFVSGLAENTNSIFCEGSLEPEDVRFCESRNHCREASMRAESSINVVSRALPSAPRKSVLFA